MTAVMTQIRAARVELMADLEALRDAQHRIDLVEIAAIETGGTFIWPQTLRNWGPMQAEISLLGISAMGPTPEAAIASWIAAVSRSEIAAQDQEAAA